LILPPTSFASDYNSNYTFHVKFGRITFSYKLYTSVSPSLYDYYYDKSHNTYNYGDYAKFVTPNVFKSVAENIQNSTNMNTFSLKSTYNDEVFANAVLEIIHQIPYTSSKAKYPVETIVDNSGDCDGLSLVAASILKSGGLDVVLFYYPTSPVSHMNVGVHLPHEPIFGTRANPTYYEFNGKKYYTAETTSGMDWKVGDQSKTYAGVEPQIISLENCESESPGEVASNLGDPFLNSSISLNLIPESSNVSEWENAVTISGSVSPAYAEQPVTIYIDHESSQHDLFKTVTTDHLGTYSLTWNFNTSGTFTVQSSWSGAYDYSGSDSEKITVHVGLNQLLDQYATIESWWIGSEVIEVPTLSTAGYNILSKQVAIHFLEKNFTGTGVLLSSEFIIIGDENQNTSENVVTIPSYETTMGSFRRHKITVTIPEQTLVIPVYEQKLNNHLEFSLRQNGENNYSVSVKLLDSSDISQLLNSSVSFFNATSYVRKNLWYNVEAHISQNQTIARLFDTNATYLEETAPLNATTNTREFRILIKYDPESIIVFKSLKAEIPDQPTQLVEGNNLSLFDLLAPQIETYLFEALMILAVAIPLLGYARQRRKRKT
jgi:hypothetical protein